MNYTIEEQQNSDIDWFSLDEKDNILFFASGGGALPKSISSSKEENETLKMFFNSLPIITSYSINPLLETFVGTFQNIQQKERYMKCFIEMAVRGLYAFDNSSPGSFPAYNYHLVAQPDEKLVFKNLPRSIQQILRKTVVAIKNTVNVTILENE